MFVINVDSELTRWSTRRLRNPSGNLCFFFLTFSPAWLWSSSFLKSCFGLKRIFEVSWPLLTDDECRSIKNEA